MSELWVRNASPLILFARVGQQKDPTAEIALKWAERYGVKDFAVWASVEHWILDQGRRRSSGKGRRFELGQSSMTVLRCAVTHRVPVIASLGVVLRSKKNRQINRARPPG